MAAADPVLVGKRADRENALAAGDLPADHPIDRTAIEELVHRDFGTMRVA